MGDLVTKLSFKTNFITLCTHIHIYIHNFEDTLDLL